MTHSAKLVLSVLLSCCVCHLAYGQTGGFGGSVQKQWRPPVIAEPNSYTATMARQSLDVAIELGEIKCELSSLGELLSERLEEAPVFVDERAIKMAELSPDTIIEATLSELPLRSALRHLLRPHALRVVVEEEGLVITADFTEVTRRGLATNRWVDQQSVANAVIRLALDKSISLTLVDTPLDEAMAVISESVDLPIIVDARALEEIGLDSAIPVSLNLKDVTLSSYLKLLLQGLDLTFIIRNEVMQITTIESAEQNLINRIYFLEGIGIAIGDYQSAIDLIQTSVVPDTWEALGGPSTMAPIPTGSQGRPALVVSTTNDVHIQIESLLESMRASHVGPDPRTVSSEPSKPAAAAGAQPF